MTINKKLVGNKLSFELKGRLDTITAPELQQAMDNEVGEWEGIIIDLEKVEYISSAGIRVLLSIYKKYGALEIVNANEVIKEVFEMTGMSDLFTIL